MKKNNGPQGPRSDPAYPIEGQAGLSLCLRELPQLRPARSDRRTGCRSASSSTGAGALEDSRARDQLPGLPFRGPPGAICAAAATEILSILPKFCPKQNPQSLVNRAFPGLYKGRNEIPLHPAGPTIRPGLPHRGQAGLSLCLPGAAAPAARYPLPCRARSDRPAAAHRLPGAIRCSRSDQTGAPQKTGPREGPNLSVYGQGQYKNTSRPQKPAEGILEALQRKRP